MQVQLSYGNTLPNFQNTFPTIGYEIQEQGPILVTRRYVSILGGIRFRQELITESVDHILSQVLVEDEWRRVGAIKPIA